MGVFWTDWIRRINDISDLEGKKIGIAAGSLPWKLYSEEYPHLNIIEYNSSMSALNDLSSGIIDVYPDLLAVTNYRIKRNLIDNLEVTGERFFPESSAQNQLRLAVRNDWPIFKTILEKGMNSITDDEFLEISEKWSTQLQHTNNIGLTKEEQEWLSTNNIIRVSIDINSAPPYQFIDDSGKLSGISGELLESVAKLLGVKIELSESASWSESFNEFKGGQSDLLPTVIKTNERQKEILFTGSYNTENIAIFALKEDIAFNTLEGLDGHKVSQVKNDAKSEYLKLNHPEVNVIEVDRTEQALNLLATGQVDAYVGELSGTLHYLVNEKITNIIVVGETPIRSEISMGINPNVPLLASSIQKALNSIPSEEKERIVNKWMAVQIVSTVDYELILQIAIIASLVIAIIIYWNNKLRGEVKRRIEIEDNLKIEQTKNLEALEQNNIQLIELQFQRETIEKSAEAQVNLIEDLAFMTSTAELKNKLLTDIINNTGHGIVVFSKDLKLLAWNKTFQEIMGLEDREYKQEMDLKSFFEMNMVDEITYDLSIENYIQKLNERIKNRLECNEFNWDRIRSNGVTINTTQRIMDDGTIINTYKDVTLERQEERRIQEMALCDGLTGLANRRSFDVNMDASIHQFNQFKTPFLLAYMDLDNFKNVNDVHGHNAGDAVLIQVSDIIKKHVRDNDVPTRLGGDEFAIIFNNTKDIEVAVDRLDKIIVEISGIQLPDGIEINIGASAGVTPCLNNDISASEIVEIADRALYTAKQNGKGQVHRSQHQTEYELTG